MLGANFQHSLLRRQMRRCLTGKEPLPDPFGLLLGAVDVAYQEFDKDRALLERAMELSSNELLQANREMSAVFQAIPDLLFRVDATGRILSAKSGASQDPLLRNGAGLGQFIHETVLAGAGPQLPELLRRVLSDKIVATLEFALPGPPPRLNYEARLVPVDFDEVLVILRNITERKQAEEALRHLVSLQHSIFESTADGILVVNLDRRIVSFNSRFAIMWHCPPAELIDGHEQALSVRCAGQLTEPEQYLAQLDRLYAEPDTELQDTLRFRDGRIYERYSCAQRIAGRPVGRVWSFRDVTVRVQAEQALRAEQERFGLVVLATRDAIYDWNMVTGTIWRNEAFKTIYAGERALPENQMLWDDFVHPDDLQRVKQSMADVLFVRRKLWSQEYRFARADGTYATIIDRGHIIYDSTGRPQRMIGAMTDLSEHKRLEEQFLQSQKMEAIGQLAGGVAHDFNNLLTVILGNLSFLREGLSVTETALALDQCEKAAQRASNLTRQLLTFSRRERVELKPLDLNEVVAEMTKMFQRLVGEHIEILTSYAPGRMPVLGDTGNLEQLLMNLVVNSRDAMSRGGRLLIQTSADTLDDRQAAQQPLRRPGRFVRLRVTDNGSGIPAELLPRIFEPFFTTKDAGKGTGLGLATVFGIVQQHGGWVEVESTPQRGTTMHVYLPRLEGAAATGSTGSAAGRPVPGGEETILLAEDETMVRDWMGSLLRRHGYRVFAVGSGQEALDFVQRSGHKIDLLVTDMVMPGGISGRQLGEMLEQVRPGLKVLYCSGYTDEFLGAEAGIRDSVRFLAKPFDATQFLQRIRERLGAG